MRILLGADWIVTPSLKPIKGGWAVIERGEVKEFLKRKPEGNFNREINLRGILYPPFVNAHTHLELSNITFSPESFKDFFQWLIFIIGKRASFSVEEIKRAVAKGIGLSRKAGVYYLGDISSFGVSPEVDTDLKIVPFREFIGREFKPENFKFPVSAHSPYSVSFEALKSIAKESIKRGKPFQIHLGETEEERKLISCRENRFEKEIYPLVGRKKYPSPCFESLTDYLERTGALNSYLIAVHCTNLKERELKKLTEVGAGIVLCPRSNSHLKVGKPPLKELLGYEKLAVGTDGLSTNTSLSVVEEIKALYYSYGGKVSIKELLPLITIGGARVLGIEDYGKKAIFTFLKCKDIYPEPFSPLLTEGLEFEILDFSKPL
ncbi:MAG: amidohydrolase family protein [Desulfurobacteriaceae bacterium]